MLGSSPVRFRPAKYVIWDLDGTILDTESIMLTIMSQLMETYNCTYTNEVRMKLMGRVLKDVYEVLVEELDIPVSFDVFCRDRKILYDKYMTNIQLMPGAEWIINWLHEREVPMAVATSSTKEEVDKKTQNHQELFKKFHHITTADEVEKGKPWPDIFLLCASKFPLMPTPKEVVVIEDAINGVEAARSAGMQVVWIADKNVAETQKRRATKTISCLIEFDPKEFSLARAHLP